MPGIRFGSPTGARPRSAEALPQDLLWRHVEDAGVPTLGEARMGGEPPPLPELPGHLHAQGCPASVRAASRAGLPCRTVSLLSCVPTSRSVDETAFPDKAWMADALSFSLQ